jgi:hypothetical protein
MLDKHVIYKTKLYLRIERNRPNDSWWNSHVKPDRELMFLLAWKTELESAIRN